MHLPRKTKLGFVVVSLIASATSVHAQVTEYTDRSSFQAATSSLTTFTFDGYAPAGGLAEYPNGLTIDGITFTVLNYNNVVNNVVVADPNLGAGNPFNSHQYLTDGSTPDGIAVTSLPIGTTAFGVDLTGFNGMGNVDVTVDNQTYHVLVGNGMSAGSPSFVGFTSDSPLTGISFYHVQTNGGFGIDLDNVSFSPAAVPEASTTVSFGLLLTMGLGGIVFAARKKKAAV